MTAPPPPHRHNGGPLNDEDARKLWNHIRALENLEEQKAELNIDVKARKELAKGDGFDTNILVAILKRRKQGFGATAAADNLIRLYEEALEEQKLLPLENVTVTVKLGSAANGESETPAELSADDGA